MTELSRRNVLRTASVLGVGAAATGSLAVGEAAARVPGPADHGRQRRHHGHGVTTFVYVTGSNGSAGAHFELAIRGHRVIGVDLPGHGPADGQYPASYQAPQDLEAFAEAPSPVAGIGLDDYTRQVVEVLERVAGHGPVVLVGGSMGGTTISRVANQVPDLIDRLVYDAAFVCVDLPSANDYFLTPEGQTSKAPLLASAMVGDPAKIGAQRINWRSADAQWLADAKQVLMEDATEAEFLATLNSLQPDESLVAAGEDAKVDASTWGRIPRTYIRHTLDRMIPLALQDRMIAEADALTPENRFDVRTVRTGHVARAGKQREIVEILDGLAP